MASQSLSEHYAAARAAWPEIDLAEDVFSAHVQARCGAEAPPAERAPDLYLACACAQSVAGAADALVRAYEADLRKAVGRIDSRPAFVADTVQATLEHVLTRRGQEPPRIAGYEGRAPLRSWLMAATVRVALNFRRGKAQRPHETLDREAEAVAEAAPELGMLRARFKEPFEEAIRRGVAGLSRRDRALLRLHLVERMGIDGLAKSYNVGRATAARWLVAARAALLEKTREHFCREERVAESDFRSIAAALESVLEVSLVRNLQKTSA
jgi:RNA polymerase sigma-70 factor (ECF subfamily)